MPRSPTQDHSPLGVTTPLPPDTLLLRAVVGSERLGRLFQYDLELLAEDPDLDFGDLVGAPLTVRIDEPSGERRYVNGIASRFEFAGTHEGGLAVFRATLRPWFWLLSRSADCRIFQDRSVVEIVDQVFSDFGFGDYDLRLSDAYDPIPYCVQYRETTFNFLSRLLEEEGIYYHFEHSDGRHVMVLCDGPSSHGPCAAGALPYRVASEARVGEPFVARWSERHNVQPGRYAVDAYDFEAPRKALAAALALHPAHRHADFEVFDWPEPHLTPAGGDRYARIRAEEQQAEQQIFAATTDSRGVTAGGLLTVQDLPRGGEGRFLVLGTTIEAGPVDYSSGPAVPRYECRFDAVDASRAFRPARITPKPVVHGPQTAVVAGKAGEEIWTDRHARIKVQFRWDRAGRADEASSCWVRVAQGWAGNSWGCLSIPRIGQEVVVGFLDGDPDRPLVIGSVYNGDNRPPNELPDQATCSTFKSNSTKGGGGFNELTVEDRKGQERIYVHAERDLETEVRRDRGVRIGRDDTLDVGRDRLVAIERHERLRVADVRSIEVGGSEQHEIEGDRRVAVGGSESVDVAASIAVEAGEEIRIQCGASRIVLKSDGTIQLDGVRIQVVAQAKIEAQANAEISIRSSGQLQAQGMSTAVRGTVLDLSADAIAKLKGGVTMIG
jgi:type VI secretion system secreted protein VgrG